MIETTEGSEIFLIIFKKFLWIHLSVKQKLNNNIKIEIGVHRASLSELCGFF